LKPSTNLHLFQLFSIALIIYGFFNVVFPSYTPFFLSNGRSAELAAVGILLLFLGTFVIKAYYSVQLTTPKEDEWTSVS
jgi:hypothetical protein